MEKRPWGMRVALAFDQLGNALMGGREDETISSRCGRIIEENERAPRCTLCKVMCWALNFLDKNHCKDAIEK